MKVLLAFNVKKILLVIGMPLLILFKLDALPKNAAPPENLTENVRKIVIEDVSEITGGICGLGNDGISIVLVTDSNIRVLQYDKNENNAFGENPLFRLKLNSTPNNFNDDFWQVSEDGYLYYYDTVSKNEIGSKDSPFNSIIHMNGERVWHYIELPCKLPDGQYTIYEVE